MAQRPRKETSITVSLIGLYLCINVCALRANEVPGIGEVLHGKRWIIAKQISFTGSQPASLFEQPHRYASASDAGDTAHHVWLTFDARKIVARIADDPAEQLRLLGPRHFRERLFSLRM